MTVGSSNFDIQIMAFQRPEPCKCSYWVDFDVFQQLRDPCGPSIDNKLLPCTYVYRVQAG